MMQTLKRQKILVKLQQSKVLVLFVVTFVVVGVFWLIVSHAATPTAAVELENGTLALPATKVTDTSASANGAIKFGAASTGTTCTISDKLENSCRAWLGSYVNAYPGISGFKASILDDESRLGRKLDVPHNYHPVGSNSLSSDDVYMINRANTIVFENWKPSGSWAAAADTTDATVNAAIDSMANSIKAVAPHKILLTIWHEPENDVTGGAPNCASSVYVGGTGTVQDYIGMWHHVHDRFAADGVTNVVWVFDVEGFSSFDCMAKDLWPGNSYVDWIMWDPYSGANSVTWNSTVSHYYNWLSANTDASHDYTSKIWGLGEFGIGHGKTLTADQAHTYQFYDDAKAALDANTYPRIKLYTGFDAQGTHDTQTLYVTTTHVLDQTEQDHYNLFANDPKLLGNGQ